MVDVKALLEYNEKVRHSYFEALCKLPWDEFIQNREASFHSMRNIFLHTMGAIDYWLDVLQQEKLWSRGEFDKYKTYSEVRAYTEHVENRMRSYLRSLPPEGLKRTYTLKDDETQKTVTVTAEDILIHVFEEEVHHRGELIALLWQIDVEPPMMSWKEL